MNTHAKLGIVAALMVLSVMAVSQPASAFVMMATSGPCDGFMSPGAIVDCGASNSLTLISNEADWANCTIYHVCE
jgi:hypothetical protein